MIGLLLMLGFAVPQNSQETLSRCIERKDSGCVASLLRESPPNPSPEYLALAARGYMLLQRNEEALKSIDRALELKPGDHGLLMERGWLCQRSGDQPAAIQSFLLAAKGRPDSPEVLYELGMSFFFAHEYDRAAKHFTHVLELDPRNDRADFMLGIVAIWRDQLTEAESWFKKAIELKPKSADYLLHYGVLLAKLEQNELAVANIREAERIDDSNPLIHLNLGKLYRLSGNLPGAKTELEAALRLRSNLSSAAYQLAGVYRQLGDQARARETLALFQKLNAQEKNEPEDPIDDAVSH